MVERLFSLSVLLLSLSFSDSFLLDFADALSKYSQRDTLPANVYFRDVDQSDPEVRKQMESFMNDLAAMDSVSEAPRFFWVYHFNEFLNRTVGITDDLSFNDQIAAFLDYPITRDLYEKDIVLDEEGNIVESRGYLFMDNVDMSSVGDQIKALDEQLVVTEAQPINEGRDRFAFFLYGGLFNTWAFYSVCVNELITTTILGIVAVTAASLFLIPHWSAALFTLPLIGLLYVDLLGALQVRPKCSDVNFLTLAYFGL